MLAAVNSSVGTSSIPQLPGPLLPYSLGARVWVSMDAVEYILNMLTPKPSHLSKPAPIASYCTFSGLKLFN